MLDFITKEPINKGWSCDKKYCVTTADGTKYLLRVTPFEKSANRENMYIMQKQVEKLGVPMCKPVDFGKCDEGVYTLQTWIDGKDANEVENKVKVSKKVKNEWPSSKGGVIRFAAASNGDGYYLESGQ